MRWLFRIAARKAVEKFVQALLASAPAYLKVLESYGISVSFNEALLISSGVAFLEFLRNWVKFKLKKGSRKSRLKF